MDALVVHQDFPFAGKLHKRGEVLFGEEADAVALSPFGRLCAATADGPHFDHLRPDAPAASTAVVPPVAAEPAPVPAPPAPEVAPDSASSDRITKAK